MNFWAESGSWAMTSGLAFKADIAWHGHINIHDAKINVRLRAYNANRENNNTAGKMAVTSRGWCWTFTIPAGSGTINSGSGHATLTSDEIEVWPGRGWNREISCGYAYADGSYERWGTDHLTKMPEDPTLSWNNLARNSKTSATFTYNIDNNHDFNFARRTHAKGRSIWWRYCGYLPKYVAECRGQKIYTIHRFETKSILFFNV